jgi:hypothetical protein
MTSFTIKPFDSAIGRLTNRDGLISFFISFFSLLPLLIRGPSDFEEHDLGIFSGRFAYKALFDGSLGLWLPDLGFGTPMPIGQSFGSYPPFILLNILGIYAFFCFFWLTQLWLGTYFMFRLCRQLEIGYSVAFVVAVSFALSKPVANYGMTDGWPTAFFTWTIYPVIIFLITDLLVDKGSLQKKIPLLGLVLGLWLSKSHPGHSSLLLIPLFIYIIILIPWRNIRVLFALSVACFASFLVSLDTFIFIYKEASLFPPGMLRNTQSGYTLSTYLLTLLYPLISPHDYSFIGGIKTLLRPLIYPQDYSFIGGINYYLQNHFSRGPFFGTPFMLLAFSSLWVELGRNRMRVATGIAFISAFTLSMADTTVSIVFSGLWLARDPLILFGMLTAAMLLSSILKSGTLFQKRVGGFLLASQLIHITLGHVPLIASIGFDYNASKASVTHTRYAGEGAPSKLKSWLTDNGGRKGQRIFLSKQIQDELSINWRDEGIYGNTDLTLLGLTVVTGWFKNISMDSIYPSRALMHGAISGDPWVMENKSFLDVAGIRWLLVGGSEAAFHQKNSKFKAPIFFEGKNGKSLALLENPNAWPMAVFIDSPKGSLNNFPRAVDCPHAGISCANLETIKNARKLDVVTIQIEYGQMILRFPPSESERQIFLSFFAHDGWIARTKGVELPIQKVGGAFMNIVVPAGIGEIELNYGSAWRLLILVISITSSITLTALLTMMALKSAIHKINHRSHPNRTLMS